MMLKNGLGHALLEVLANLTADEFRLRTGSARSDWEDFFYAVLRVYREQPAIPGDELQLQSQSVDDCGGGYAVEVPSHKLDMIQTSLVETLQEVDDWEFELLLGVTRPEMETFLAEWLAIAQH